MVAKTIINFSSTNFRKGRLNGQTISETFSEARWEPG